MQVDLKIGDCVGQRRRAFDAVASMPFLTMQLSNGVPARIDWPTMRCCQPTTLPPASRPALIAWKYIGR